jgi:hypothetical protein
MQRAVLFTALAVLAPLTAHADTTAPARPPPRPPMPKVTSVDDLVGDWTVTSMIRLTSCNLATPVPGPSSRREELWTIEHQAGTIEVRTDFAQEYTGPAAAPKLGSYRHQLGGRPRATEEVLQLSHYVKDRFFGTILRAQSVSKKGVREVCVTQIDISGKRATP